MLGLEFGDGPFDRPSGEPELPWLSPVVSPKPDTAPLTVPFLSYMVLELGVKPGALCSADSHVCDPYPLEWDVLDPVVSGEGTTKSGAAAVFAVSSDTM